MGKTALVTGASTGIGFALAKALGGAGWQVFAGARKIADLERLDRLPGVNAVPLDVTDAEHRLKLTQRFQSENLDVLVNNAGVALGGPWEVIPLDQLKHQFEVNVFGVIGVTQAVLPAVRRARGRIINVSSISGKIAGGCLGPYAASKFALEAFTDSLRRELVSHGVKVISLNPGPIATPIWEKGFLAAGEKSQMLSTPELMQAYGKQVDDFIAKVENAAAGAEPVANVVAVLMQAIESSRPKSRYYVGKGIWFAAQLTKLPDPLLDKFVGRP